MKHFFTSIFIFLSFNSFSQIEGFESDEFALEPESFWNGSDGTADHFLTLDLYFPTSWDTSFGGFWSGGWAYSNMTDSVTSGFSNLYSAKAGSGFNGSENYAVANGDGWFRSESWAYLNIYSLQITNTTFAYNSMRDGDAFAKKFGGISGNDPDFFRVIFTPYDMGIQAGTPDTFYLADYRFEDNSQDYIISDWTELQFTFSTFVDSISYRFESSDIVEFGINTPLFFAIDDIEYGRTINSIASNESKLSSVFPNPASSQVSIQLNSNELANYQLYSIDGRMIRQGSFQNQETLNLEDLNSGVYLINIDTKESRDSHRLIIQ